MRSGGSGGGGGYRGTGGAGFRGGGGTVHSGSGIVRGGYGGYGGYGGHSGYGGYNSYRGGYSGYRGGYYGFRSGTGFRSSFYYGGYWPYWGLGYGYAGWPGYYGGYYGGYSGYYPYADYGYDYGSAYASPAYYSQPNVTVVYPSSQSQPEAREVYVERANPVIREYDQYGQQVGPSPGSASSSPIYLIAFRDQVIHAAISYSVSGSTLRYVTMQHEEKQVPLDSIDRNLTLRLNRERRIAFQLP